MTRFRPFALLCIATALLTACDSAKNDPATFETDAGEAAVRHLISSLPELNPGVAKNYSIVLGELTFAGAMTPATEAFVKRFEDLKLEFVNAIDLKVMEPGPIIVDNKTRLATFVLQLRVLSQTSETTWESELGWSYKDKFERQKVKLELRDGKIVVTSSEKTK